MNNRDKVKAKVEEAHQKWDENREQMENRRKYLRLWTVDIMVLSFLLFAAQSILLDSMGIAGGIQFGSGQGGGRFFLLMVALEILPMLLIIGGFFFWYTGPIKKIYDLRHDGGEIPGELEEKGRRRADRLIPLAQIVNTGFFVLFTLLGLSFEETGVSLVMNILPKLTMALGLFILTTSLLDFIILRTLRRTFDTVKFDKKVGFIKKMPNQTFWVPLIFLLNGIFIFLDAIIKMVSGGVSRFDTNRQRLEQIFNLDRIPSDLAELGERAPAMESLDISLLAKGSFTMISLIVVPSLMVFAVLAMAQKAKLRDLDEKVEELATGHVDLTKKIRIQSEDELALITSHLNDFIESLRSKLHLIYRSADRVSLSSRAMHEHLESTSAATEEMVASVNQVSRTTTHRTETISQTGEQLVQVVESLDRISASVEHQAAFVDQTSSSVNQMAASIASVTQSTRSARDLSSHLRMAAKEGEGAVTDSIEAVKAVEVSSEEVNNLVSLITETSETTNLLAMNAAIEAAHAGEAGKGFAVVADEVRRLAVDSAAGAGQITKQIQTMVAKVGEGVKLSEEAGNSLGKVITDVEETSRLMEGIALSMDEQNTGANEILKSISSLVEATATIREVTAQQKSKNEQMRQSIEKIIQSFNEINMATEEQALGAKEIVTLIGSLQDVARENQEVVKTLAEAFSGFKLD